jgi:hypothetical protein
MQTTHRFFHAYSGVAKQIKTEEEGIKNVYRQAEDLGGVFTRIVRGLPEGSVANFSPSIIKHGDRTLIAWRTQPEPFYFLPDNNYAYMNRTPTEVYIGELANDSTIMGAKKIRSKPHRLSYEDPRLFHGPDKELYVQFVGSTYASSYNKGGKKLFDHPKVVVCHVNAEGEAVHPAIPPIGENKTIGKAEKNWCFFSHKDELKCLYSTRPLVIECEKDKTTNVDTIILDTVTGGSATFNSLPPISLGYGHIVFYHWKHMTKDNTGLTYLLYHLGAYIVDKDFTKITHIDPKPLFSGSLNDRLISWTNADGNIVSFQPAVILPFGAYVENTDLVMSLGVNDAFMGVFRCPIENLVKRLTPVT